VRGLITDCHLKSLEEEQNVIHLQDEELWRQRIRATWLKSGDQNTRFFNNYADTRRNKKYIWEILDEDVQIHRGQEALKKEAKIHFKGLFDVHVYSFPVEQVNIVRLFY
jgi:hypothetical protein